MGEAASSEASGSIFSQFFTHLFDMPKWHKTVLAIAAALSGVGLTGHVMDSMGGEKPSSATVSHEGSAGRSSVVRSDQSHDTSARGSADTEPSWLVSNAPWLTRVGFGFIAGFVIGWAFRAFIKMMTLITLAATAIFFGLSYFHVVNIDLSDVKKKYDTSSAWVTDQATKLKDVAMAHIPSGASGFGGMFVGFLRKK